MSSMDEKDYFLSPSDLTQFFMERNYSSFVSLRKNDDFVSTPIKNANFIGCFNSQNTSIGTGLIPFLEHDDANRALMGSNMQRQALPLKNKELSFIETGIERQIVKASELNIIASSSGIVGFSSNKQLLVFSILEDLNKDSLDFSSSLLKARVTNSIKIFSDEISKTAKFRKNLYSFSNIRKSNQSNILNQKSFLKVGDWVRKGDFVVDGNCSLAGKVCCT